MTNSYINGVENGQVSNLKEYLLICGNAGSFVKKEDGIEVFETKLCEVSDFHLNKMNEEESNYNKFLVTSNKEIQLMIDEDYTQRIELREEKIKAFEEGKKRCLDMLEKLKEWTPPTKEHGLIKEFGLIQLEEALSKDYNDFIKEAYFMEVKKESIKSFKARMIEEYLWNINYHKKEYGKELTRVNESNKWVKDLIDSF